MAARSRLAPRVLAGALVLVLLVAVAPAPSTAACVSLQGSKTCPGYPVGVGVDSNMTWVLAKIGNYFNKLPPNTPAEDIHKVSIANVQDFDRVMTDIVPKLPVAPLFSGCNVPRDYLRYYNAFVCTWIVQASSGTCTGNNVPATVMCRDSTVGFFQSIAAALNSSAICPGIDPVRSAAVYNATNVLMAPYVTPNKNSVSEFYNGQPGACSTGELIQASTTCGYGSEDAACDAGCVSASCSALSTGAIIGIVIAAIVIVAGLAAAAFFYLRRQRDARDGKLGMNRGAPYGGQMYQQNNSAPRLDVPIPDSPLVQTPMMNRFGRQSFIPGQHQQQLPPNAAQIPALQAYGNLSGKASNLSANGSSNNAAGQGPTPQQFSQLESYYSIMGAMPNQQQQQQQQYQAPAALNMPPIPPEPPATTAAATSRGNKTLSTATGLTAMDPRSAVDMLSALVRDDPTMSRSATPPGLSSGAGNRTTVNTEPMHALQRMVNSQTPPPSLPPSQPASMPLPPPSDPPTTAKSIPSSIKGNVMTVSAHFEPDLSDELAVTVGDRVRILKVFDDDWVLVGLLSPYDEVLAKGMVPLCVFEEFASARAMSVVSGTASAISELPLRRMSAHYNFK
ncbi:rho guanine nucleotide exchange factor [Blastocladiella emersonii ATCC 22665]|nr:rho guanine nucleotide exchange factor [Blastocladiella emersonii ATCC 22665]